MFGCRQQFCRPFPHLDFMINLLLKIMILKIEMKNLVTSLK
jgi:hypothetical protein